MKKPGIIYSWISPNGDASLGVAFDADQTNRESKVKLYRLNEDHTFKTYGNGIRFAVIVEASKLLQIGFWN